jgi:hypothetical protein
VTGDPSAEWLTLNGELQGTLDPGETVDITFTINDLANGLTMGAYPANVQFTNTTDHIGDTSREVILIVGAGVLKYEWLFNEDPGWTTEEDWAFGQPQGLGGEHGDPDPTSGFTGDNVYGYNLAGDYPNGMAENNLTSTAIDCSNLYWVHLKFMRWLGVESADYDHAYVRVSSDGINWATVWANEAEMTAGSWEEVNLDISSIASDQETVYLRWTMGTTDEGWMYCGWNIDDVQIYAVEDITIGVTEETKHSSLQLDNYPNPFHFSTSIRFELTESSPVSVAIFDMQGRKVRTLVDGYLGAGIMTLSWDGTNETGNKVQSGIYTCILLANDLMASRKMLILQP